MNKRSGFFQREGGGGGARGCKSPPDIAIPPKPLMRIL